MPLRSALATSAASGRWRDHRINDDRLVVDAARGLFLVCDASGPIYGGYYAPYAIDPAIEAALRRFSESSGGLAARVRASVEAAHTTMSELGARYEAARGGRFGLEAARATADLVRPETFRGYESFAHFSGSMTVCAVDSEHLVVAQVGACRAYAFCNGQPEPLIADHTLPSVLEADGASAEAVRSARETHGTVVTSLLGYPDLKVDIVERAVPPCVVLCTDGVWRAEHEVRALFEARTDDDVRAIVQRCAEARRDDATAVVLRFA